MRAIYVPPVKTPSPPEHISRALRTAITNRYGAPSDECVAVFHAHIDLETGRTNSCFNYNLNNTKAGEQYEGEYTCLPLLNEREMRGGEMKTIWYTATAELEFYGGPVKKGTERPLPPGHPQSRFRAFRSLAGAANEKIRWFLESGNGRWRNAFDLAWRGLPGEYVDELKLQNFFTAQLEPYRRAVISLFQMRLPLARSTREGQASPPEPELSVELCHDMAACHRFELPPELRAGLRVQQATHVDFALDLSREQRDTDIAELDTDPATPEAKG